VVIPGTGPRLKFREGAKGYIFRFFAHSRLKAVNKRIA
jgi:hypothetical protein